MFAGFFLPSNLRRKKTKPLKVRPKESTFTGKELVVAKKYYHT